ncbi:hypothetical protein IMSHALPRED_001244 [Imshaugia aleurites]|uniref:Uncharacterized protein n=1 Tax=Imshaugia aleurites TaxID=172621 RepID=A0A8H3J239_9LECA|nr:hypothetical protein IMSHALPRED_001244 [Imshaugia aleurites]
MASGESVSAEKLETALSRLEHHEGAILVVMLVNCSIAQFRTYLMICSVDRDVPVHDHHSNQDVLSNPDDESLLEWQRDTKATSRSIFDADSLEELTSEALASLDVSRKAQELGLTPLSEKQPADSKLCQRIHDLPSELFLQIQEEFLNMTFGPRSVYPYNELRNSRVFEALNQRLLAKYQRIFFSENTWIMGQGYCCVEFLDRMPQSKRQMIRKVEMAFTTQDYPETLRFYFEDTEQSRDRLRRRLAFSLEEDRGDVQNPLKVLRSYQTECLRGTREMVSMWCERFEAVSFLNLDYFVLDLSDAYAPDGEYLGVYVARHLVPFTYGLPAGYFHIRAPTQALADEIWDILWWINS